MELRDPPLVGRQRELEAVAGALADESCRGVVLQGAAGVGKTRLAGECLRLAEELGFTIRRVLATAATRDTPLASMASLVPPLGAEANPLGAALAALRSSDAGRGPLLLLVDDAQWMDDTSAGLLQQALADGGAFGLLTVRTGEPQPPAVARLMREAHLNRVDVHPLDEGEIEALVEAMLDARPSQEVFRRVVDLADGNPLIARELIAGGLESGALDRESDTWRASSDLASSRRIGDLVTDRISRLDDLALRALAMVALAEPLPLEWVARDWLGPFGDLETGGLVATVELERAELRMAHPLYGEVLRARLSPLQRRAALVELIEMASWTHRAHDHDRLRLVVWSQSLGVPVAGSELREAARRAFSLHRFDLAAELLAAVPEPDRHDDFRLQYANALSWVGRHDDAQRVLDDVIDDPEDDLELARAAHHLVLSLSARGDHTRADEVVRQAHARVRHPEAVAALQADLDGSVIGRMPPAQIVERVGPLLDLLPETTVAPVGQFVALALVLTGRPEAAAVLAEGIHRSHRSLWLDEPVAMFPSHPSTSLHVEALALSTAGRLHDASTLLVSADQFEPGLVSGSIAGMVAMSRGHHGWLAGDVGDALQQLELALDHWSDEPLRGGPGWKRLAIMASIAAAQLGRERDAARHLRTAESSAASVLIDPGLPLARAWAAVAHHRTGEAVDLLASGLTEALDAGAVLFAIDHAFSLFRLDAADRVPASLIALRPSVDGDLLPAQIDAIAAAQASDAGALVEVGDSLRRLGADIDAAEAYAAASRFWAAQQESRRSVGASRQARSLLSKHPEVRTPGLILPDGGVPLTAREREVAALAAEGTPARLIAERLFISERTVANHLQHVYDKLGVSSRADLRTALEPV